jgi:hypothetical protein
MVEDFFIKRMNTVNKWAKEAFYGLQTFAAVYLKLFSVSSSYDGASLVLI